MLRHIDFYIGLLIRSIDVRFVQGFGGQGGDLIFMGGGMGGFYKGEKKKKKKDSKNLSSSMSSGLGAPTLSMPEIISKKKPTF